MCTDFGCTDAIIDDDYGLKRFCEVAHILSDLLHIRFTNKEYPQQGVTAPAPRSGLQVSGLQVSNIFNKPAQHSTAVCAVVTAGIAYCMLVCIWILFYGEMAGTGMFSQTVQQRKTRLRCEHCDLFRHEDLVLSFSHVN